MISSARIECHDHSPLRDEHPDHAILSRCDKEFAFTAPADVEIRARDLRPHRLVDKFLQRHVYALPALIFYIELNFFDPIVLSISSCSDTFTRFPPSSFT